ncbi:MAG: hypothetical protein ACTSVV_14210 [Promethearchaeota archaeon]
MNEFKQNQITRYNIEELKALTILFDKGLLKAYKGKSPKFNAIVSRCDEHAKDDLKAVLFSLENEILKNKGINLCLNQILELKEELNEKNRYLIKKVIQKLQEKIEKLEFYAEKLGKPMKNPYRFALAPINNKLKTFDEWYYSMQVNVNSTEFMKVFTSFQENLLEKMQNIEKNKDFCNVLKSKYQNPPNIYV